MQAGDFLLWLYEIMNETLYKTDSKLIKYLQANLGDACFNFELM